MLSYSVLVSHSRIHKDIMSKLTDIHGLSEQSGLPIRKLRSFVAARKIPFLKCGHRTLLFDVEKVNKALARFEVPAVGAK